MTDVWYCEPPPPPCVPDHPEPPCKEHADNGWGNGSDPTNPGSPPGSEIQSETKSLTTLVIERFIGRFDGR